MREIIGNTVTTPMTTPDWNQTDKTKADYIKNKPTVLTEDEIIDLIEEKGGDVGVQADWNQTDDTQLDYIKNKPNLDDEIDAKISSLVDSAPETLNTLNELATALGEDPNFATTMTNELAKKINKSTTLSGYGIEDAYTISETDQKIINKADKATTLAGYGITNAYTKTETETKINEALDGVPEVLEQVTQLKQDIELVGDVATVVNLKAEKNVVANALKETVTGEIIGISDVSPITHTVNVKVKTKNLIPFPFSMASNTTNGVTFTVNDDQTITVNGTPTVNTSFGYTRTIKAEKGKTYTLSHNGEFTGSEYFYVSLLQNNVTVQSANCQGVNKSNTFTANYDGYFSIGLVVCKDVTYDNVSVAIQLEEGDTATEYEPYIDPTTVTVTRYGADETDNLQTYTPNADGTVEITSVSPTMTVLTNTAGARIDLEYNQDVNAAMGNIKEDITTLDNDMAEIKGELTEAMAEVGNALKETASGEIVAINDVSPITHTVNVKVESKNLFDASKIVFANNNSKVNSDGTITAGSKEYFIMVNTKVGVLCPDLKAGDIVVFSKKSSVYTAENVYLHGGGGLCKCGTPILVTDEILNSTMALYGIPTTNANYGQECTLSMQVERGEVVTDWTPYIDPKTATLTRCKKNLIPYPYYKKAQTAQGITWTVNDNGAISATGTATDTAPYFECIGLAQPILLKAGTYIFSGCPVGGDSTGGTVGYYLAFGYREKGTDARQTFVETGNSVIRTFTTDVYVDCMPCIKKDTTVSNLVFEPMIRVANITDDTFELYDSETFEPSEDCIYEIPSTSPIMTLLTDTTGAKIEVKYNQDICAFKENVTNTIAQLTQAIIELGGTV